MIFGQGFKKCIRNDGCTGLQFSHIFFSVWPCLLVGKVILSAIIELRQEIDKWNRRYHPLEIIDLVNHFILGRLISHGPDGISVRGLGSNRAG